MLVGEDPGAPCVHEQGRVPGREEAHRNRSLGGRKRRAREVEQLAALLVAEAAELHPLERLRERADAHPGPVGDVRPRRRPERAEVAADEVFPRLELGELRLRPDPLLGEAEEVGPAPLPGPGGRHADEVGPEPDPGKPEAGLRDLLLRPRPVREEAAEPLGRAPQVALVRALHAPRPRAPLLADRDRERPVVAARDDVDRAAHQRRLHQRAPLERAGHRLALRGRRPATRGRRRSTARTATARSPSARRRAAAAARRRSSSSWRASIARFSSRDVSTRSATAAHANGG